MAKTKPASIQREPGTTVNRWVPTYINSQGLRTLINGAQGRNTFPSKRAAERYLRQVLKNNSAGTIASTWGSDPKFEVRPVECWAGPFDPCGIYFD